MASAAIAGAACGNVFAAEPAEEKEREKLRLKKAVKIGMVQSQQTLAEKFRMLKELGFDGVELDAPGGPTPELVKDACEQSGLIVHGVVDAVHWKDHLGHPDAAVRARGLRALERAIQDAKAYGATSVLLVPAVVSKEVGYEDAYKRSQAAIKEVLPMAEEMKIRIALENVWNNFLLSPIETARYVDELESPFVGVYFDVGNVLRYGWPEQWIRILGPRVFKIDVKEYSLKKMREEGVGKGFDVELLEGDCDWPAVMKALNDIHFEGWGTAEIPGGGRERLAEISKRMDRINAS